MNNSENDSEATDSERWYAASEYHGALRRLDGSITLVQRRMLIAHAEAPECMLSVRQLAAAGGYDKPKETQIYSSPRRRPGPTPTQLIDLLGCVDSGPRRNDEKMNKSVFP